MVLLKYRILIKKIKIYRKKNNQIFKNFQEKE